MTLKGGTTQACAACKFQRRKCTPECLLAPYFPHDDVTSQLELGMAPRSSNALALFNQTPQPQSYNINNNNTVAAPLSVSQQHSYSNSNSVDYNNSPLYMDSKDNATNPNLWIQCPYTSNNSNSITMQPHQLIASESQPLSSVQQGVVEDNYDEMHSFFDTVDDRQSYIYSKEAYESSSEESLKDTRKCTEHVSENELKSAAACFSLTSVN